MSRLIEGLESIKVLFDTTVTLLRCYTPKTQRIENMETMIEDMEERIAIMSEGGWISVDERLQEMH